MRKSYKDYDLGLYTSMQLYEIIAENGDTINNLQLIYKYEQKEYITENISLEWLQVIDSHGFYRGLELKKIQKQKYNVKDYKIVLRLHLNKHANR